MMGYRNNVKAVLETCFAGFKDELIEAATDMICNLKERPLYMVKADGSIESLQKTGKWIVYKDCEGKTRRCVCDRCGYETGKYTWINPNFCENCGAKMEEEKDE